MTQPEGHGRVEARRGFFVFDFLHGFFALWRGAAILFRPELAGRLTVPALISFLTVVGVAASMGFGWHALFTWLLDFDWGWAEGLKGVAIGITAWLLTIVSVLLLAPPVIEAILAPFLDPLAGDVERLMCGSQLEDLELGIWRSLTLGIRSSAQVLVFSLLVLVPGWLITTLLFPIGFLIVLVVAAAFAAAVWFEIPFARRGYGLRHRLRVLRRNWARALGFGFAFQVGICVPVFNFTLLGPAAAVGVTMLYFHFEKDPEPQ